MFFGIISIDFARNVIVSAVTLKELTIFKRNIYLGYPICARNVILTDVIVQ